MHKLSTLVCSLALALGCSTANAAPIFQEDFDSYSAGNLTGQGGWQSNALVGSNGSLQVSATFTGSPAAGHVDASNFGPRGNSYLLGSAVSSGDVTFTADMTRALINDGGGPQFWLFDTSNNANASLRWSEDQLVFVSGGLGMSSSTLLIANVATLRASLRLDLDNQQLYASWFDVNDPNDPTTTGSVFLGNYTGSFAPQRIEIRGNAVPTESQITAFDNIVFQSTVPEPSTWALMLLVGVAGLTRVRKR